MAETDTTTTTTAAAVFAVTTQREIEIEITGTRSESSDEACTMMDGSDPVYHMTMHVGRTTPALCAEQPAVHTRDGRLIRAFRGCDVLSYAVLENYAATIVVTKNGDTAAQNMLWLATDPVAGSEGKARTPALIACTTYAHIVPDEALGNSLSVAAVRDVAVLHTTTGVYIITVTNSEVPEGRMPVEYPSIGAFETPDACPISLAPHCISDNIRGTSPADGTVCAVAAGGSRIVAITASGAVYTALVPAPVSDATDEAIAEGAGSVREAAWPQLAPLRIQTPLRATLAPPTTAGRPAGSPEDNIQSVACSDDRLVVAYVRGTPMLVAYDLQTPMGPTAQPTVVVQDARDLLAGVSSVLADPLPIKVACTRDLVMALVKHRVVDAADNQVVLLWGDLAPHIARVQQIQLAAEAGAGADAPWWSKVYTWAAHGIWSVDITAGAGAVGIAFAPKAADGADTGRGTRMWLVSTRHASNPLPPCACVCPCKFGTIFSIADEVVRAVLIPAHPDETDSVV